MNSNPYTVPAIVLCAFMLLTVIAGLCWATARRDRQPPYRPGHTHRAVRARLRAEARDFADPRDATDPDGEDYVRALGSLGADPRHRVSIRCEAPALETLARVHARLLGLAVDDTRGPAGDDTRHDLHAVATWGKTPAQLADELAARYLT